MTVRPLGEEDAAALDGFLREHADGSLFLRANLRTSGIVDRGAPYHGTYAGAFDGRRIVAVAAHYWNDNVIVQAPSEAGAVARAAVAASGRAVSGLLGPWAQVVAARGALGLATRPARLCSREVLLALPLAALVVPPALAEGRVVCRPTRATDLPLAAEWRVAYSAEELRRPPGPESLAAAREDVAMLHGEGRAWMLETAGVRVAFSAFNARLPDVVQIGGVFTPPELRRRGYGRAVVAGSLLAAARDGGARAVLFTGEENVAALAAYAALGFRPAGDYGIVLF